MAVFRIERTKNYTVMSNYHLRDKALSLKSKGLLSMMLSLPEDWNYTTRGLAKICKEGVDAIGGALRELEAAGYIVRHQLRDRQGRNARADVRHAGVGMRVFMGMLMVMLVNIDKCTVDFNSLIDLLDRDGEELGMKIHTMHEDIFDAMHKI